MKGKFQLFESVSNIMIRSILPDSVRVQEMAAVQQNMDNKVFLNADELWTGLKNKAETIPTSYFATIFQKLLIIFSKLI